MKIVVLDGHTTNPGDLSWHSIERLGTCTIHSHTPDDLVVDRARDAEIILTNKTTITKEHFKRLSKLEFIGVLATGYDVIDIQAASDYGVVVSNAAGYSTMSVVQHTYALILELLSKVSDHSHSAKKPSQWAAQEHFSYTLGSIKELSGKNLGIVGFGTIGKKVAAVGKAFDMNIIANRRDMSSEPPEGVVYAELNDLLQSSDIITLHCPLTKENNKMVNLDFLNKMQPQAFLINTARGGLINEQDLSTALLNGSIAGAGLDVLSSEPPPPDHILLDAPRCLITPHVAWASIEARRRLINITTSNIRAFLIGEPINEVRP